MSVRPNWRDIPVVELTDEEVAQMSSLEDRWCSDLLVQRANAKLAGDAVEPEPEPVLPIRISQDDPRFDRPNIAVMVTGIRIWIYPGEHEVEGAFAGEKMPPLSEREVASNSFVSVCWDRSKVVDFQPQTSTPIPSSRREGGE